MLYIILIIEILFLLFLLAVCIHASASVVNGFRFAPFVPTERLRVETMIRQAHIAPGKNVMELGSGDGRICIAAAKQGAQAIGFEADPILVLWSRIAAYLQGVKGAHFKRANIWAITWPIQTEVVFVYGLPRFMERVWEKACKELRPGTRVISHAFPIPGLKPIREEGAILVYEIPEKG